MKKLKKLRIQFEKNDEFNYITSAMFNAYLISTLKFALKNKTIHYSSNKGSKCILF